MLLKREKCMIMPNIPKALKYENQNIILNPMLSSTYATCKDWYSNCAWPYTSPIVITLY